jgi:exonuclease SbcC
MKPLSLQFTAFGSYPGTEEVDFTKLIGHGLYVVTGPTGSGKTTIFDAMAYALYGEVPGARDKGDIRSQHAQSDVRCSVVFRFEIDGEIYRVERAPEQFKPRKRGEGESVKDPAKATLLREADNAPLENGATKVSKYCANLVGLDATQFERVVLLPQGQFQQFLLADTAARLPLLQKLFGTQKWAGVVSELRNRANEANAFVAEINRRINERKFAIQGSLNTAESLLPGANENDPGSTDAGEVDLEEDIEIDPEDESDESSELTLESLRNWWTALVERVAPLVEESHQLGRNAEEAATALNRVKETVANWDRRVDLLSERELLDDEVEENRQRQLRWDTALAALPVIAAAAKAETDAAEFLEVAMDVERSQANLGLACVAAGLEELLDPDVATGALVTARATNAAQRESVRQLLEATGLFTELQRQVDRLVTERQDLEERLVTIEESLAPLQDDRLSQQTVASSEPERRVVAAASEGLLRRRRELADASALIPNAIENQRVASERQRAAIEAFDASAAPRLAESLQVGQACPVCGSQEHPSPAAQDDKTTVSSEDRDAASKAASEATDELRRLSAKRDEIAEQLGDAVQSSVEELEQRYRRDDSDHAVAVQAIADVQALTSQIENFQAEREVVARRLAESGLEIAGLHPQVEAAQSLVESLQNSLGEFARDWEADAASIEAVLNQIDNALDALELRIEESRIVALARIAAEATAEASGKVLADTLSESPFASVEVAISVHLDEGERERISLLIKDFEVRNGRNRALLEENLKIDLPDERPDITNLELAAHSAREVADQSAKVVSRITEHLDVVDRNLTEAEEIESDSGDAVARAKALESLAKTCDGQGPRRVALETWILAGELERVAAAANHHLAKMTSGRYQLERSDLTVDKRSQSGLDLRVLDAHTGSSRRPGSLSGGEQFQASLALALGLADVIGHGGNASGRVFEALFVDEGFGSLDPESLQEAVDALGQIQAGGRTVGVITHVEAMKEQLAIGIRVERLANGKGSTLNVYPHN